VQPARGELLAQAQERQVLGLGLEHDVHLEAGRGARDELLEADRVDEVRVARAAGEHERALHPPAHLLLALLHVRARGGVVDLRRDAGLPRGARELERLAVRDPLGVVAVVVQDVPHDRPADPPRERQDVAQRVGAVVVLDHEAAPGALGQQREAGLEAVQARRDAVGRPPTWSTTTASGPGPWRP
jgi:hypothetical protein